MDTRIYGGVRSVGSAPWVTSYPPYEVLKSTAEGFIVKHTASIESDIATVFETMTAKVGQWWNPDHSFSGNAANMLIDNQCFCERWDENQVRHLNTVIWLENAKVVMDIRLERNFIYGKSPPQISYLHHQPNTQ